MKLRFLIPPFKAEKFSIFPFLIKRLKRNCWNELPIDLTIIDYAVQFLQSFQYLSDEGGGERGVILLCSFPKKQTQLNFFLGKISDDLNGHIKKQSESISYRNV